MKKLRNIAIALVVLVFSSIIFSYALYQYKLLPVGKGNEIKIIEIKAGESTYDIGKTLEKNNLIKSGFFFRLYLKLNDKNNLKAGYYELKENMGVEKIVNKIVKGDTVNPNAFNITIPEGKNFRYIVKTIADKTNNKEEEIYALIKNEVYLDSLIDKYWFLTDDIKNKDIYYSLEGYLFPSTYTIDNKDVKTEEIFKQMLDQADKILSKYKTDIEKSKYSIHELLTLASIVELEGVNDKDRGKIAGVFYNRLDKNMPLGSDVTTYYAIKLDNYVRDLKSSEINAINKYNTRSQTMAGKLPVSPICNPGEESIKSAIIPEKNDYLYFVADKNKNVYFTKTNAEHEAMIKKIKDEGNWIQF
jgi:UPF0755 protein